MSLLPQRKKSPEEIAKLRETLGVPASPPEEPAPSAEDEFDTIVSAHHEAIVVHHAPEEPHPAPPAEVSPPAPKPTHSLKHSERDPVLPVEKPEPAPEPVPHLPKPVRSLRKSEQVPVLVPAPPKPAADSKIPYHRKSDEEIAELRRREALAMLNPPPPNPKLAVAHLAILIPGYLSATAGASCFIYDEVPMAATAACSAVALLIAAFIFQRRPISRHHAAFIAVISLFVIVFGALHFFPNLQHAT